MLSRAGSNRWSRVRSAGASAAIVLLLGTAALAPFSVSDAFVDRAWAVEADGRDAQGLTSASAPAPPINLSVAEAEEEETKASAGLAPTGALYSLDQFIFSGVVNWGGYRFTYYSQQVLPGAGLMIPGRHVNPGGYVSDGDGYIVLAGSAPKGAIFDTPFGYQGKIYDRGTSGNHLDVYIR